MLADAPLDTAESINLEQQNWGNQVDYFGRSKEENFSTRWGRYNPHPHPETMQED